MVMSPLTHEESVAHEVASERFTALLRLEREDGTPIKHKRCKRCDHNPAPIPGMNLCRFCYWRWAMINN